MNHAVGRLLGASSGREAAARTGPRRFRALLEDLGGTFIKFGQVLALQPDVLPSAYCEELFDLMDRVPPCDFGDVEAVFREDLGRSPLEVFDDFERRPMASASIGQVHAARLDDVGVAVKIQRPTALRDFGADLRLMGLAVTWIRRLGLTNLDWLTVPMGDFVTWTTEELDYRIEARFMERLAVNAADRSRERIPRVFRDLTSQRVLTAELLEGPTLLDFLRATREGDRDLTPRLAAAGFVPERFAENIVENFLDDVLEHGVFHADLHPANLLILPGSAVGYVDFGITGVISRHSRYHVTEAIVCLAKGDLDGLFGSLMKISEIDDLSDVEGFRRGLRDMAEDWLERRDGRIRMRVSYSAFSIDLLQLTRRNHLHPHPEVVRYIRSVVTCDGLIRRFAPGVDLDLILEEHSRRLLGSKALARTVSVENLVDWWAAGSRLLRDGATRLDTILEEAGLERGETSGTSEGSTPGDPPGDGERLLRTALVLLTVSLLMVGLGEPARPGFNLFTAEALLLVAGTALFLGRAIRWLIFRH